MKQITYIFATIVLLAVVCSGCRTQENNYPQTLTGYWVGTPQTTGQQTLTASFACTMDIDDNMEVTLTTITTSQDNEVETFTLSYDNRTGKGTITNSGKALNLQARNDTTLSLWMTAGEVIFKRTVRPADPDIPTFEGYYTRTSGSIDTITNILVYATESDGTKRMTVLLSKDAMAGGYSARLLTFNTSTGEGTIETRIDGIFDTVPFCTDYQTIQLYSDIEEAKTIYTRQPQATDMPQSLSGKWTAGLQGYIYLVADINTDNTCLFSYDMSGIADQVGDAIEDMNLTDTISGYIRYSAYAGKGVLEFDDKNDNIGDNMIGYSILFEVTGQNKAQITMSVQGKDYNLEFTRQ